MQGPLSVTLNLSHAAEMAVAVLVGIGFGFVLERAGFGRSDNLTSIFYGRDFRVMRVMFTAIVTAMLGLYTLDLAGVLPLYSIGILDTYLWAQLVGGLVFGAGFIIGGYCPGTSIVALVGGKIDAVLFLVGLTLGSLLFAVGYDALAPLQNAKALGRIVLHEAFGLPSAVVVLGVVLFAVGCFVAVGRIESLVNARRSS